MLNRQTIDALNLLLTTHYRSLPMYLTYATPWTHHGDERIVEALRHIVADQKDTCARIAKLLQDSQAPVDTGDYPMGFTDLHDLSLDYLMSRLIRCQAEDLATISACLPRLAGDPAAHSLAEEALGAARAHQESLSGLAAQMKPAQAVQ